MVKKCKKLVKKCKRFKYERFPLQSNGRSIETPRNFLDRADKILFILEKYGVIRHSEIKRINEMLPGITRKSTRTYYKNYKRLIDQRLVARIKEKTIEQQYYAYSITENGRFNLRKLLGITPIPSEVKDLVDSANIERKSNNDNEDRNA